MKARVRIVVASLNPTKLAGTEQAFKKYFNDAQLEFATVAVPSGVAEQPLSIQETLSGAITRARNAGSEGYDYAVGIEGGMHYVEALGERHAIETGWACVLDCKTGRYEIGACQSFVILPNIERHMAAGENLSDAMKIEYGLENLGAKNGYVGWLTDDLVDRTALQVNAVLLALATLKKAEA